MKQCPPVSLWCLGSGLSLRSVWLFLVDFALISRASVTLRWKTACWYWLSAEADSQAQVHHERGEVPLLAEPYGAFCVLNNINQKRKQYKIIWWFIHQGTYAKQMKKICWLIGISTKEHVIHPRAVNICWFERVKPDFAVTDLTIYQSDNSAFFPVP